MKKRIMCLILTMGLILQLSACTAGPVTTEPADTQSESTETEEVVEEASKNYGCDLFEITLPDGIGQIAQVETTEDRIDIYHKESVDAGFGGLVLSLWGVKVPKEFAGGPYEKIGELTNENGDTCDMVRGYATEIQWDYNLPDMPDDFKKIDDAVDEIIGSLKGVNGYTYREGAGMKGDDLYPDVLAKYVQAVNECWDADKLESEEMCSEFYFVAAYSDDNALDKIGYAYADINSDGIEELFLGVIDDEAPEDVIYDVYTMVDRKPAIVVSGTARNRYYNYDNAFLCNEWSGGAGQSGVDVYALMSNSTELVFQYGYKYDSYEDEEKPWFSTYDQETYEPVSEEEFNERTNIDYVKPDYRPLSEVAAAAEGTDTEKSGSAKLPAYAYPGPELFYSVLYQYLIDTYAGGYPAADVTIPCPNIIAEDESDPDDIRVWGDFWVLNYDLNGDILENASGGSYPGCIHLKKTDDGYEVTGMDVVGDGSDFEPTAKKIFGKYYEDLIKSSADTEGREKTRAQIIANYVAANDLQIKAYQDYGWDPVELPEENIDSFYSQLD
ncbi:MAG: hypothetical protein J5518_09935 [Lachnospiraceae bacterium]|nr:hypothetical protein [Lachnospiraceae bacterium]